MLNGEDIRLANWTVLWREQITYPFLLLFDVGRWLRERLVTLLQQLSDTCSLSDYSIGNVTPVTVTPKTPAPSDSSAESHTLCIIKGETGLSTKSEQKVSYDKIMAQAVSNSRAVPLCLLDAQRVSSLHLQANRLKVCPFVCLFGPFSQFCLFFTPD